ncbi:Arc family DNA-binding protein [Acinetobacter sp. 256-1]|uniref:Arc family DNA-binding protein n=1 Tax=Acinetobacter sp. 256-1 TaxID=2746721 RepID=UPI00257867A7|nr:Arc family DNA-binding protein [Acinetobacter sp. 256-1]MDM1757207.1 Arc family DNA-binding protein [Acinetobacter sp. 256-1]
MSNNGGNLTVQYNLRWSEEMRDKVAAAAKENTRSMNQEIIARLEKSFENVSTEPDLSNLIAKQEELIEYMKQLHKQNTSLQEQLDQVRDESKQSFGKLNVLVGLDEVRRRPGIPLPDEKNESDDQNWQKLNPNNRKK